MYHVKIVRDDGLVFEYGNMEESVVDSWIQSIIEHNPEEYTVTKTHENITQFDLDLEVLRQARTIELNKCDWTQLADAPLTVEERNYYREYRQYLRDLPLAYDSTTIKDFVIMDYDEFKTSKGYNL